MAKFQTPPSDGLWQEDKNVKTSISQSTNSTYYCYAPIVGGATIWANLNYWPLRMISVKYQRILFSGFGGEDFLRTQCSKHTNLKKKILKSYNFVNRWSINLVLAIYIGTILRNILAKYQTPPSGGLWQEDQNVKI